MTTNHNLSSPFSPFVPPTSLGHPVLGRQNAVAQHIVNGQIAQPSPLVPNSGVITTQFLPPGSPVKSSLPLMGTMPHSTVGIVPTHRFSNLAHSAGINLYTTGYPNAAPAPLIATGVTAPGSVFVAGHTSIQKNVEQQKLKVEDALTYLDQVKSQFGASSVYNDFLEIMKQFKQQAIDTSTVIQRVSELFKGHSSLILGFNAFLPAGYSIKYSNGNVQVATPNEGTPLNSTSSSFQPQTTVPVSKHPQLMQTPLKGSSIGYIQNGTTISKASTLCTPNQQSLVGSGNLPKRSSHQGSERNKDSLDLDISDNVTVQNGNDSAEFDRAVSYVNKIKMRFAHDPQVYNEFLEILKYYQKDPNEAGSPDRERGASVHLTDKEVYSRVTALFKNDKDLMNEFASFLPEMSEMFTNPMRRPVSAGHKRSISSNTSQLMPTKGRRRTLSNGSTSAKLVTSTPTGKMGALYSPQGNYNFSTTCEIPSKRAKMSSDFSDKNLVNTRSEFAMFDEIRKFLRQQSLDSSLYDEFIKCVSLLNNKIINKDEFLSCIGPLFMVGKQKNCLAYEWLVEFLGFKQGQSETNWQRKDNYARGENYDDNSNDDGEATDEFEEEDCNDKSALRKADGSSLKRPLENSPAVGRLKQKLEFGSIPNILSKSKSPLKPNEHSRSDEADDNKDFDTFIAPIDLYACPRYGTSYRIVPKEEATSVKLSKLDPSIEQCINTQFRSVSSSAGDTSYVPHSSRKNNSLDYINRIEDERFELDMLLAVNASAIKSLELLQKVVARASSVEVRNFDLRRLLSPASIASLKSALARVYGDKWTDVYQSLFSSPKLSLHLVKNRLRSREEHWTKSKSEFAKVWNSLYHKHSLRALDHKCNSYKNADVKKLKCKSLVHEVEHVRQCEQKREEFIEPSAIYIRSKDEELNLRPHLEISYASKAIIKDADRLLIYYLKRNLSNRLEKSRIKRLLKHFMKDLSFADREELSDDEFSIDEVCDGDEQSSSIDENEKSRVLDRSHSLSAQESNEPGFRQSFLCTNNWYLFFRLHVVLSNKLAAMRMHCDAVVSERNESGATKSPRSKPPASVELGFKKLDRSFGSSEELYSEFLNEVCDLLDNKIDSTAFEDFVRANLGLNAYEIFTLDKVIQATARQLQLIVSHQENVMCLKMFVEFNQSLLKNPSTFFQLHQIYSAQVAAKVKKFCNLYQVTFCDREQNLGLQMRMVMSEQDTRNSDFEGLSWPDFVKSFLPQRLQKSFLVVKDEDGNVVQKRKPLFLPRMINRGLHENDLKSWDMKRVYFIPGSFSLSESAQSAYLPSNPSVAARFTLRQPFICYRSRTQTCSTRAIHGNWAKIRMDKFKRWLKRRHETAETSETDLSTLENEDHVSAKQSKTTNIEASNCGRSVLESPGDPQPQLQCNSKPVFEASISS